jgi:hypothetical protein
MCRSVTLRASTSVKKIVLHYMGLRIAIIVVVDIVERRASATEFLLVYAVHQRRH